MTHFIRSYTIETLRGSTDDTIDTPEAISVSHQKPRISKNINWIKRYLQNPFSIAWSKLATLITTAPAQNQVESHKVNFAQQQDYSSRFSDRVDPSVYYSIFLSHN